MLSSSEIGLSKTPVWRGYGVVPQSGAGLETIFVLASTRAQKARDFICRYTVNNYGCCDGTGLLGPHRACQTLEATIAGSITADHV